MTQITQIQKKITRIGSGHGNGYGNEARMGYGNGHAAVTVADTGFVAFTVAFAGSNL